ncbi:winged helix-turn-helix transcriptional regulator [bacterium]|nr:MAG: winged helix-turn-helix transcriptional regulator [bacterium]
MADSIPAGLAIYETGTGAISVRMDGENQTCWLTQKQIAEMFGVSVKTVNEHLKNLAEEGEIEQDSVIRKFRITASDEKSYDTAHYSLDGVLAVGYRVSSARASAFRKWATAQLKDIIVKGYAINEERIRQDAAAQQELFKLIRSIRLQEANTYQAVRDIFKASSSDYDAASKEARQFFYTAQDLFHYAITLKTAAQIKLERCNSTQPFCGLTTTDGADPGGDEAQIAKNYLKQTEIEAMDNLCLQWMLYAESNAMRGKTMTMGELLHRIQQLLQFNGYPVMWQYPDSSDPRKATNHVKAEMAKYRALHPPKKNLPKPK